MTGERTKRFPLGLADLVREPRRRDGLDQRQGEARAPLGSASKPGAAKGTARPAAPRASGGVGAGKPGQPHGAGQKSPIAPLGGPTGGASTAPTRDAAPRAAQAAAHLSAAGVNRSASTRSSAAQRANGAPTSAVPGALGAPGVPLSGALALTSERVRERMVERLRANGITDPRVLQALAGVPRHMFVDPGLATQAYEDAALPIGHQQTISKPSVVARMLELAGAGRTLERVL